MTTSRTLFGNGWVDQRSGSHESVDAITIGAADICGRCQAASKAAKETEPANRKERSRYNTTIRPVVYYAFIAWTKSIGIWSKEDGFLVQYSTR